MRSPDVFSQKDHEVLKKANEAAKQGKRLPEYDEKGDLINPYIPMYISKAPWYMKTEGGESTGLGHQRVAEKHTDSSAHHLRGINEDEPGPKKYRKGACENCGALSHSKKDCVERPRERGAKWTGKDIRPDEFVHEASLDFEGKRDRWAGYDPEEYAEVIKQWEEAEAERKSLKQERTKSDASDSDDSDEADDLDALDMPGQKVDLKTRMTVRNLRLREDTAKYLSDLSADASLYDPKTRSMRSLAEGDGKQFVSEGGGSVNNVFAWESDSRGKGKINLKENVISIPQPISQTEVNDSCSPKKASNIILLDED